MIEGEHGTAIIEGIVVLKAADAVNSDTISTSLFSSIFAQALRSGQTPREVALALWDALPCDDDWDPVMRERFESAIDLMEERGL
jgi:hypothetical protein